MNPAFSVYLDLVRFAAACLVYMYHSNQRLLVHDVLPMSQYGHSAVIVFFVLSGYVIAFVTDTKEREWRVYAASRLSRVYSVAVPALALTVLLDYLGRQLLPTIYTQYPFDQHLVRAAVSLSMLNEWWFLSVTSFSNVPYWSITYEIWYYVAFGLLTFLPRRWALKALLLLFLALGPKLLLLAPIWATGVWLYRDRRLQRISSVAAWTLLAASWVGIVAFHSADVQGMASKPFKVWLGGAWFDEFTFSKFFVSDYLLTAFVAMNFLAMRRVAEQTSTLWKAIEAPVRWAAAYTFTLYLLHQPLFLFWAAVLRWDPHGPAYWLSMTALTAVSVVIVGHFTETQRHGLKSWTLKQLRRWPRAAGHVVGEHGH